MNINFIAMLALAIFVFLFGLFSVTNIDITWGKPIMGWAAMIAGTLLLISILRGSKPNAA